MYMTGCHGHDVGGKAFMTACPPMPVSPPKTPFAFFMNSREMEARVVEIPMGQDRRTHTNTVNPQMTACILCKKVIAVAQRYRLLR